MSCLPYLLDYVAVVPVRSSHSMVSLWVLTLACRSNRTPTSLSPAQPDTNHTGRWADCLLGRGDEVLK